MSKSISIKNKVQIEFARKAGQSAALVLAMIKEHIRPGVSMIELDDICRHYIIDELKVTPANIGYHGFPKTICTSLNQVVCHGIPSDRKLEDGDIINIDVAVIQDGWFGDTSRMYTVGTITPEAQRLVDVTLEATWAGIRAVRPGATLGDVGNAIQAVAERENFSIVRDFCGHGIGQEYHEAPQVLHYGIKGKGLRLKPGMIFTIEPMLNAGGWRTETLADGWTVVTKDRSLSAQWEHMVVVTQDGVEVLTNWPDA
ncbi:type I methionyl aminopeptidase [Pseudomonas aeruginosa]|uniref:type I methionyl aminopeptidase n=1 Tax=Pseudomonas aeruginosa TaxID=287 RepID=UPI0021E137E7|nr:type I methionyl aminopeptidase [Pseudomonas aeruginosa]MCV0280513.1 type I methionyl aminopeptidase [Pseudomonas aeruginosa]